eukprot:3292881-Amphidinium_carterae.1
MAGRYSANRFWSKWRDQVKTMKCLRVLVLHVQCHTTHNSSTSPGEDVCARKTILTIQTVP